MKLKAPNEDIEFEYEPVNSVLIDVSHRGPINNHEIEDS